MTEFGIVSRFLHVPAQLPYARTTVLMPLSKGGLGLGCVVRARHAAHVRVGW